MIWGEPIGYAFALALKAKRRQYTNRVDQLHHQIQRHSAKLATSREEALPSLTHYDGAFLKDAPQHSSHAGRPAGRPTGRQGGCGRGLYGYWRVAIPHHGPPIVEKLLGSRAEESSEGLFAKRCLWGPRNLYNEVCRGC